MLYIECHERVPAEIIRDFDHKFTFEPGDNLTALAKELAQNEVTKKTDLYRHFVSISFAFFDAFRSYFELCDISDLKQAYDDIETEIVTTILTNMIYRYFINPNLVKAFISVFFSGDVSRLKDYESISTQSYADVCHIIRGVIYAFVLDRFDEICTDPDDRARVFDE